MSMTFTKLFSSITESSVWVEDDHTRLAWITMMAMADKYGRVWAAIPGLANRARIPVASAEKAIACFLAPDPYSRTKEHDGRRIEAIDGGWRLLNHAKYRKIRDDEARKEQNREAQERFRKSKQVSQSKPEVSHGKPTYKPIADADADADAVKTKTCHAVSEIYSPESRVALHWLNEKSGRHFRETEASLEPINARLKEPGVDIVGVKQMISRQCELWKDTRMQEYLRPETLFGKEKFNSYYAAKDLPVNFEDKKQPPQEPQNGY